MRTSIFIPPMAKCSGGLIVLMRLAQHLHQSGFQVRVALREQNRPALPSWLTVPVLNWDKLDLTAKDIWVVPEGWINALSPGLKAAAHCIVYVQNWAYLFSSLPPGVSWHDLPVSFLAVSRPVAWFIRQTLAKDAPVLTPGIDRDLFLRPRYKPQGPLRVAFMPRKNKALADMIRSIWEARNIRRGDGIELVWEEIHGLDQAGVARTLQSAHIFLATGFPEGCPLPPLEAMACGCLPVGYTGFGGWEYMSHIERDAWRPWFPLPENSWSGNGFWVPDGDALAVAMGLEKAVQLWTESGPALEAALQAGQQTVRAFDLERQRENIINIWPLLRTF